MAGTSRFRLPVDHRRSQRRPFVNIYNSFNRPINVCWLSGSPAWHRNDPHIQQPLPVARLN
eukprot:6237-Eustigmatos_ZCMA.PRE.1